MSQALSVYWILKIIVLLNANRASSNSAQNIKAKLNFLKEIAKYLEVITILLPLQKV